MRISEAHVSNEHSRNVSLVLLDRMSSHKLNNVIPSVESLSKVPEVTEPFATLYNHDKSQISHI